MKSRVQAYVSGLLWTWVLGASAAGQSLLQNGAFEAGSYTSAYGALGNSWEPAGRPSLTGSAYSLSYYSTLGYYQRMGPAAIGSEAGICQRVTGLTPGKLVTFAGSVYQKMPGCTVWVAVDTTNSFAPGDLPARSYQVPYSAGEWPRFEVSAVVGTNGAVAVYVWAYCQTEKSYVNTDNLSLTYAPSSVTDVSIPATLSDAMQIRWTSVLGAGTYEIRYATQPITDQNWEQASVVASQFTPVPAVSGTVQSTWVRGLSPGTTYHVAIKFVRSGGTWSDLSNIAAAITKPQGSAPYWAWITKERLTGFYNETRLDCVSADANRGASSSTPDNPLKWYFGGWDPDCERQIGIGSVLTIVRDTWMLDFWRRLSDHVWDLTFANWPLDKDHYNNTLPHEKIPAWNESHHAGECSWNGVGLVFHDWDNPKWLQRLEEYAGHVQNWTGYTGSPPHLHFKSFWMQADDCNCTPHRNVYCQVDNPENRRFTRALWYAAWRDPDSRMPDGRRIKDFLYDLDTAQADDAMRTDLGKPLGMLPGEIRFDTHQIGGYSGQWWRMAGSHGGTIGTSGEWWYDWRWGFVQSRDAYWEQVDQWKESGYANSIATVRETLRYFSVDLALNNIPPAYMYDPPITSWPDSNEVWGNYQYLINYLYRTVTKDPQFDPYWLGHAQALWQHMPPPGAPRYANMIRSQLAWDPSRGTGTLSAKQPFMLAWLITRDKEWLCRAMDEMFWVDVGSWLEAVYNGVFSLGLLRRPDQPITWNNTDAFTNFAALVLDYDDTHVKWLTYNFDATDRPMSLWLWSLQPGMYALKHGPDANLDDQMDSVAGTTAFAYTGRRTQIDITMPADRMEVFEIVPLACSQGGDTDGDGVADHCDNCPNTLAGARVDAVGCPVPVKGDLDHDGDVDQTDFGLLQVCLTGSMQPVTDLACMEAKLDADNDVDADDLAVFLGCSRGPDIAADPDCAN